MYNEFKTNDAKLSLIMQNAKKFNVNFAQNEEILKLFFQKDISIEKNELESIKEIFKALEIVKTNSQMSG